MRRKGEEMVNICCTSVRMTLFILGGSAVAPSDGAAPILQGLTSSAAKRQFAVTLLP
jgi:hypothetical protein